jgi:hypothetical protein
MNWSAEQQRLLHALGHDLMVHGTQWPVAGAAVVGAALAAMPLTGPIAAKAAPTTAPSTTSASSKVAASQVPEKLLEALRRAAGGNDIGALVDDIDKLRNQPALKRALWPRLRALRRSH